MQQEQKRMETWYVCASCTDDKNHVDFIGNESVHDIYLKYL